MPDWNDFTGLGQAVVDKVKLGSAVDGPLVVTIFVTLVSIFAYVMTRERMLLWIACAPLGLFALGFIYFMIFDSDKLRSEEHEQAKLMLGAGLGESGKSVITEEKLLKIKPTTDNTPSKPKEISNG